MAKNRNILQQAMVECRKRLGIVVFFSLFINLLMFVAPLHMLQIYDRVLMSRSEVTLVVLTVLALGLLVIYGVLEALRSRLLIRAGLKFDELMHDRLFPIVFDAALMQPKMAPVQALRDMNSIRDFIGGNALSALCDAPWAPMFITVIFIFHPLLGFVALGGGIVIFCIAFLNEIATRGKLEEANVENIQAVNDVTVSVRNAEVTRAMGMISRVKNRWAGKHDLALLNQTIASDRAAILLAGSRFTRMGLQVMILAVGAYLAILDEITPGTMIAASIVMGRALAPVELAVSQWKNFSSARDAYNRLNQLIGPPNDSIEKMDLPAPKEKVTLQNVYVSPPAHQLVVVSNFSFMFKAGSITAIVGPSGCGKSSLARALVGVWPVIRGAVRYDNADIQQWDMEKLGEFIGYMPQDVELFSGTVAENIARFQEISSDSVVEAASRAGVHEMILQLPEGYDTVLGAAGEMLSGGQRQRIALARALYRNPNILILDEPNSSLDAAGENALAAAIKDAKSRNTIIIVISHRPSLLAVVDEIIIMKDGTLVKSGPKEEILSELGANRIGSTAPQPANS